MARDRRHGTGLALVVLFATAGLGAAAACSSSDATSGQSSGTTTPKATAFVPVEAPSQNPLPPGAGTKDATAPADTGTTTDSATVTDTGIDGPHDAGAG